MYAVRNWLIGGVLMMALTAAPSVSRGSAPDSIQLDALVQLYGSVRFRRPTAGHSLCRSVPR